MALHKFPYLLISLLSEIDDDDDGDYLAIVGESSAEEKSFIGHIETLDIDELGRARRDVVDDEVRSFDVEQDDTAVDWRHGDL